MTLGTLWNEMSGVSVVIPTWNGLQLLKEFLPSVILSAETFCKKEKQSAEILIVDDGSTDGTAEWLKSQGFIQIENKIIGTALPGTPRVPRFENGQAALMRPEQLTSSSATMQQEGPLERVQIGQINLRFLSNPENSGFSVSCNRGIGSAMYPFVFLLNNDVEPAPDSISVLLSSFTEPSVFAVHCRVLNSETGKEVGTGKLCSFRHGFLRVHRSYMPLPGLPDSLSRPTFYSAFAGGGASMFDRARFIQIGGFEELLSPFYWEDVEISYRAWKRGYTVLYEPRAVAHHRISSTIGKLPQAGVKVTQQRNRIILHWIHLHDNRMMRSHILWLLFLTLTAPIRFQPHFVRSVSAALGRLRAIRRIRAKEKVLARRTDRAVISIFDQLSRDRQIVHYDGTSNRVQDPPSEEAK